MLGKPLLFILISFLIITFGVPTSIPWLGLIASGIGYALFFVTIAELSSKKRLLAGTLFFAAIQLVQLYWLTSHPYLYIYGVWIALSLVIGLQFGVICLLCSRKRLVSDTPLVSIAAILSIPALWTLFEWSRLFYFTGFTFNPVGMALACSQSTLQGASLFGIYGLSFWVFLTNALSARLYFRPTWPSSLAVFCSFFIPIAFGLTTLSLREQKKQEYDKQHALFRCLIIDQRELPEEFEQGNKKSKDFIAEAFSTWESIVDALAPHNDRMYDLILFPEIIVPFQGEAPLFELQKVEHLLSRLQNHVTLQPVFARDDKLYVSSYAIAQAICTIFNCPILIGLEGSDIDMQKKKTNYFNSAFFITPGKSFFKRYDKEILLPMGEYIPIESLKPLAARYGLFDSFKKGDGVKIFETVKHKIGPSICYEDTFGHLMRENTKAGATILTNLTNDGWYPNSELGVQHLELARIRTVENGLPIIRACNFGISGGIDSLGYSSKLVPFTKLSPGIHSFSIQLSTYTYPTLYSKWGNIPIVLFSLLICLFAIISEWMQRRRNSLN